ncbi:hypothetical protein Tco_0141837, partial [Tanacetum coccineum]
SVCSTLLPLLEKLPGAELQTELQPGPKTIKSILKACSSRKAKTSKDVERISKKRTKNEAKTTKPDTEWKSRKKTKSKSKPKCRKVNSNKPEAKKSRKTSLGTKLVKSLNLFKEEKEEKKEKGPFCQFAKEIPQGPKLPKTTSYTNKDV